MGIIQDAFPILFLSFLGLAGVVGFIALISPKMFVVIAETGGVWVTAPKRDSLIEKPIDIDQFIIRNSRQFGVLVVTVAGYLSLLILDIVDPSWTPGFLVLVFGVSVLLVFSSLLELGGEVSKIEAQLAEARIDPLTGLANRRALDDELERRLSERSRKGARFCIALLDIDKFKEINDQYGHLVGDMVITAGVADVIETTKRKMDLAARYGGDEFAIIYPATRLEEANNAAENIRAAVAAKRLPIEDTELGITVSIGVAEANEGDDIAALINRADLALYAAKEAGRNQGYRHNGDSCEPIETTDRVA